MSVTDTTNTTRESSTGRKGRLAVGALLLVVLSLLAGACGSGDGSTEEQSSGDDATRAFLITTLADGTGLSEDVTTCIVDTGLESYTIEELAAFGTGEPSPAVIDQVTKATTECLLDDAGLATLLEDRDDPEADLMSNDDEPITPAPVADPEPELEPTPEPPVAQTDPMVTTTIEFCSASRDAYESFVVLGLVAESGQPAAVEQIFTELQVDVAEALVVAPNIELAKGPEIVLDALGRIVEVARANGFSDAVLTNSDNASFEADLDTVATVLSALEKYLAGPCGYDNVTATGSAAQRAQALTTSHTSSPEGASVYIDDPTTGISVLVPAGWGDTSTEVLPTGTRLLVAPDVDKYNSSWHASGVVITSVAVGHGDVVGLGRILAETAAWNNCSPSRNATYDDGTFVGTVHVLTNCGGTDTGAVLIAAMNADASQLLVVEIQMVEFDQAILDMIIGSIDI